MDDEFEPTANGLLRCLQMLSEEAACLGLGRTFATLQDAITICRAESERLPAGEGGAWAAGLVH